MRLIARRTGEDVAFNGRRLEFSFWPSRDRDGVRTAQTRLFALDPWSVIRQVVERECAEGRREEALACLTQAQAFFEVGTGQGNEAARPLALYYSYLNAAKTFCLTLGELNDFERASHGLVLHGSDGDYDLDSARIQTKRTTPPGAGSPIPQIFDEMMRVLTRSRMSPATEYRMAALMPQILSGHRLWAEAADREERFFNLQSVNFRHDPDARTMWLEVELLQDDVGRFGIDHDDLLSRSGLIDFQEVESREPERILLLQEKTPLHYGDGGPLAALDRLVERVRDRLWMTVMLIHPYRRYYIYLCPAQERQNLLPQLLSMYAVTFYFGSLTRYRPDRFERMLRGRFGPRIRDFITGQPRQLLYQLASEMARRDVARPSIL